MLGLAVLKSLPAPDACAHAAPPSAPDCAASAAGFAACAALGGRCGFSNTTGGCLDICAAGANLTGVALAGADEDAGGVGVAVLVLLAKLAAAVSDLLL